MGRLVRLLGAVVVAAMSLAGPAKADCYDILGCTDHNFFSKHFSYLAAPHPVGPNCEFLWQMRNRILSENGYCFRTERAKAVFGNEDCRYDEQAEVPLNSYERDNLATITRAEQAKGCR